MSGLIEKTKDKIQQVTHSGPYAEGNTASGTHTSTTGTHNTPGTHHTTNTGIGSTGTGSTGLHSSTHNTTGTGVGSTTHTAGPHKSNLANKLDPRVDSDRDGSSTVGGNTVGGNTIGSHTGTHTATHTGTHTGTLGGTHTGTHSGLHTGPHTTTGSGGGLGYQSGLGASGAGYGTTGTASHTAGPHNSDLLNKADPRVDSDRDGSRGLGSTGTTGLHQPGAVHSGTGGLTGGGIGSAGAHHGGHSGPGPAPNTAGPHSSDLLNKADPRVDSNLDGSRTAGGNATYQ